VSSRLLDSSIWWVQPALLHRRRLLTKNTQTTVFRFIGPVFSLRVGYWTERNPGDHQQGRKQLEGLPSPVRYRRPRVSRAVARRCAERAARGSAVGRGEARDEYRHGDFGREG
jgi:hypothetical protein